MLHKRRRTRNEKMIKAYKGSLDRSTENAVFKFTRNQFALASLKGSSKKKNRKVSRQQNRNTSWLNASMDARVTEQPNIMQLIQDQSGNTEVQIDLDSKNVENAEEVLHNKSQDQTQGSHSGSFELLDLEISSNEKISSQRTAEKVLDSSKFKKTKPEILIDAKNTKVKKKVVNRKLKSDQVVDGKYKKVMSKLPQRNVGTFEVDKKISEQNIEIKKPEPKKEETLKQPEQKETESSNKELIVSQYINDNSEIIGKDLKEKLSCAPPLQN